jgi:2-oxoisovalerate dehydrogenase E2 component (dihydrolipoyl transacylase)
MGMHVFRLPDVGEGIAEAEIVAWHVAVGQTVKEDQPLVDVMTEKATVEIGAPVSGKVVERKGEAGDMVPVGSELVVIATDGADVSAAANGAPADGRSPSPLAGEGRGEGSTPTSPAATVNVTPPPAGDPSPAPAANPSPQSSPAREEGERPRAGRTSGTRLQRGIPRPLAAPAVRARAAQLGIDLAAMEVTGPEGRIRHEDLDAILISRSVRPAPVAEAPRDTVEEVRVIGLRRQIAQAMQDAKRRIPHFSYVEEIDVTALEALRRDLNERRGEQTAKLTLLPFLIRAMVKAIPDHPGVNVHFDDDAGIIRRYAAVHIGVATQTRRGLLVPVIRHAEAHDLYAIANEIGRLSESARAGKATREELSGSTITVSSLGPLGGIAATPIVKPPEVAIVGVNKIVERPVVRDGQIVIRKMMNLSSSFDHRVVDGFDAASFIQTLKGYLETPARLFIGA